MGCWQLRQPKSRRPSRRWNQDRTRRGGIGQPQGHCREHRKVTESNPRADQELGYFGPGQRFWGGGGGERDLAYPLIFQF